MHFPRTSRVFLLIASLSGSAAAQVTPCTAPECRAGQLEQVWAAAQQIHERKQEFVSAVREFSEALRGNFGDESDRVWSSIASMEAALVRWDEAIQALESQSRRVERTAEVHAALGSVYLDRHRIDKALQEIVAAERIEPRRADVHALHAVASGIAGKPLDAADALAKIVSFDAGHFPASYERSQYLLKGGDREQGEQALQDLSRVWVRSDAPSGGAPFVRVGLVRQVGGVAPIFSPALYADGFALLAQGAYAEAIAHFKQATARDPLTTVTAAARPGLVEAGADLRQGRLEPALARLRRLAESFPAQSEVRRMLGMAYWADEQYDSSIEQFEAALRLSPSDERSWRVLADVLVTAGRVGEAEKILEKAIQGLPASGQVHYSLGRLYQSTARESDALIHFEKAVTPGPIVGQDALYEIIGGIHANHANFDGAVDAYRKRIEINPNSSVAHRRLGEIYFVQGRSDEALAEFAVAAFIDPRDPQAHAGAGKTYARSGKLEEAIDASRRAVELAPANNEARYVLATALLRAGRTEEGNRELETFQRTQAEAAVTTRRKFELDTIKRDIELSKGSDNHQKAVDLLREAIRYEPDRAANHVDLGVELMKTGRHQEATESFEAAGRLGADASIYRFLAEAYKAVGRLEESERSRVLYEQAAKRAKESRLRRLAGAAN